MRALPIASLLILAIAMPASACHPSPAMGADTGGCAYGTDNCAELGWVPFGVLPYATGCGGQVAGLVLGMAGETVTYAVLTAGWLVEVVGEILDGC